MTQHLRQRWEGLWHSLGVTNGLSAPVFARLTARYRETHRAYHTLDHVAACLAEFDAVRALAHNAAAVEIAIWFHDVIYDPHRSDNEEQSAALANMELQHLVTSRALRDTVSALVRATTHRAAVADPDQQLIVDADLSGLGQGWSVVEASSRNIRREYAFVPEDDYVNRRRSLLQSFLGRPFIYHGSHFRGRYEQRARANIRRELGCLRELAHLPQTLLQNEPRSPRSRSAS
jgi:predicted metal-dependent HD superfamily phosphohydrolase